MFESAIFEDATTFERVDGGTIHLQEATFESGATFEYSDVEGIYCMDAAFEGETTFDDATILDCGFMDATFEDRVGFDGVTFAETAAFNRAAFHGETVFRNAEALDGISLKNTVFEAGGDFAHTDLVEGKFNSASLSGVSFEKAILENADFERADLTNTNLERATLSNADLFEADLSGSRLYGVRIGGAAINTETVFDRHGENRCVYDPNSAYEYDPEGDEPIGQLRKAMGSYHVLEKLTRENTLPDEQASFFVRRQDMRRAQLREDESVPRINYWFAEVQNAVFRHGESFSRVIGWSVATIVLFALVYPVGGWIQTDSGQAITYGTVADSPLLLWDVFNHSTRLFLTGGGLLETTGLAGEVLTTIETMIAPILISLLVFVLGRRAAR
jgi:uncharacterized protein YjbI with pentapeptide repeats